MLDWSSDMLALYYKKIVLYEYIGVVFKEQTTPTQEMTSPAKEVEPTTQKPDTSTPLAAAEKTTQQQVTESTASSAQSTQSSTPAGKLIALKY